MKTYCSIFRRNMSITKAMGYLFVMITIFLFLFQFPETVTAEVQPDTTSAIYKSGTCGDDLRWELSTDGVFTVTGSGRMDDFPLDGSPASIYKKKVNKIVLDDRITYIGTSAFAYCRDVTEELVLPSSLTEIGHDAFNSCYKIPGTLIIPENVTEIGHSAFSNCSGFSKIVINEGIETINDEVFNSCGGIDGELVIPDSVTYIGRNAFANGTNAGGHLVIGKGVKKIDEYAFCENGSIGSLVLPSGVEYIGDYAFNSCKFTGDIVIPNNVKYIGNYAFLGCYGITGDVIIPKGIDCIGFLAFEDTNVSRICGYRGTAAQIYATKHNIEFFDLESSSNEKYSVCAADPFTYQIIPNSIIHIDSNTYNTDETGIYEFSNVSSGEHFVRAMADGYITGLWQKIKFEKGKLAVVFIDKNKYLYKYKDSTISHVAGIMDNAIYGTATIDGTDYPTLDELYYTTDVNDYLNKPVYATLYDGRIACLDYLENKIIPDIRLNTDISPVAYLTDESNSEKINLVMSVGWKLPDEIVPSDRVKNISVKFDNAELCVLEQPSFAFIDENNSEAEEYSKTVSIPGEALEYGQYSPEISIPIQISSLYSAEAGTETEGKGILCNIVYNSAPNYYRLDIIIWYNYFCSTFITECRIIRYFTTAFLTKHFYSPNALIF